jgi:hypothetical protein
METAMNEMLDPEVVDCIPCCDDDACEFCQGTGFMSLDDIPNEWLYEV